MSFLPRSSILGLALVLAAVPAAQDPIPLPSPFPGVPVPPSPTGSCFHPGPRVSLQPGVSCSTGLVVPPSGWYSGDTHEHAQLCFNPTLRTEEELRDEMIARGQNVASLLVWGARLNPGLYLANFLPRITGGEDPSTVGYPNQVIQYGIETSGFHCASLGHTIALNVDPAQADFFVLGGCPWDDQSGDFAAPVVDHFQQQPKTVIGYAHQSWPVPLYAPAGLGGFDWENAALPAYVGADARCSSGQDLAFPDPTTITIHPTLAAFDAVTGRLDFLETVDPYVDLSTSPAFEDRWYGLWYKLLSAGQQVAIAGGTDGDCVLIRSSACVPQTWVQLEDGQALDYDAWTEAIRAGRTSMADGCYQFLEIEAQGLGAGEHLYVNTLSGSAPDVPVTVRFHLADGTRANETIEIVQDGAVVHSQPLGQVRGGLHEVQVDVPFLKSGWLAARTSSGGAHTGAVYVFVDRRPIASCAEADYFTIYADYLNWIFDLAATVPDPAVLEAWVGCSEIEIRQHIAEGRKVFAAVRDYAAGPPPDVVRRAFSTPSGRGPMGIGIDAQPSAGTTVRIDCFNAPPGALGALIVSPWFSQTPDLVLGAQMYVTGLSEGVPLLTFPTRSTKGGYAEQSLPLVAVLAGYDLYAQWLWYNPPGYEDFGVFSSSDVLELRVR